MLAGLGSKIVIQAQVVISHHMPTPTTSPSTQNGPITALLGRTLESTVGIDYLGGATRLLLVASY